MSWLADRLAPLADEFLESYVSWREACEDVRAAYERWWSSGPLDRALVFASYRAALDREEHASRVYCEWTERLGASSSPGMSARGSTSPVS